MSESLAAALVESFDELHDRLRKAVDGLDDAAVDRDVGPETNSLAVLVTHACASELDWLHVAAGRVMERDRPAEFATKGKTAREIARAIDRAAAGMPELVRAAVAGGLGTARRPRAGAERTAAWCVLHALDHLAEHVGHVELTRQLVTR